MKACERLNAEHRKPAILKAFYEVIEAVGFENASVAKVAKQAGVHASLVIHYFGSKECMVLELVEEVLLTYTDLIGKLPHSGEPHQRLEQLLALIWSREWHEAANLSVIFSFLALSQRDERVMSRLHALYERYGRYLLEQVRFLQMLMSFRWLMRRLRHRDLYPFQRGHIIFAGFILKMVPMMSTAET